MVIQEQDSVLFTWLPSLVKLWIGKGQKYKADPQTDNTAYGPFEVRANVILRSQLSWWDKAVAETVTLFWRSPDPWTGKERLSTLWERAFLKSTRKLLYLQTNWIWLRQTSHWLIFQFIVLPYNLNSSDLNRRWEKIAEKLLFNLKIDWSTRKKRENIFLWKFRIKCNEISIIDSNRVFFL